MITRKSLHYFSGLTLAFFVGTHLLNHFTSLWGADTHIAFMDTLRPIYRNLFVESLVLMAVAIQIVTGLSMFFAGRKVITGRWGKLQYWSGAYLAIFLLIHLGAVLAGRFLLALDTNFYFGVAGLNTFPFNLFFTPYYGLAILCFFGHVAAIHAKKMKASILGLTPSAQSKAILIIGLAFTVMVFYGLTNGFSGVAIPEEYKVLVGG